MSYLTGVAQVLLFSMVQDLGDATVLQPLVKLLGRRDLLVCHSNDPAQALAPGLIPCHNACKHAAPNSSEEPIADRQLNYDLRGAFLAQHASMS